MASPNTVWQGTDKDFIVKHNYTSMTSATEVEVFINTSPQIIKKLSQGDITGVTTTQLLLQIDDADTASKRSGEYNIEARITTAAGRVIYGKLQPSKMVIKDSIFTTTN